MKNYLTIFVNGDPFNCEPSMSLSDLLKYLNVSIDSVVIEHNNNIINRMQFDSLYFCHNDSIEIITIVGGG